VDRRSQTNLALAAVTAALAAAIFLTGDADDAEPPLPPISTLDPASVREIRIVRVAGATIILRRDDSHWTVDGPVTARANPARIQALLALPAEHSRDSIQAPGDPARFDLDPPAVSVYFDEHRFDFGGTSPLDERRYVLHDGSVHLLPDHLYFQLVQNPGFFVDSRLLAGLSPPARIELPGRTLWKENGTWTMQPAADSGADSIHDAAVRWESARAISVRTPAEGVPRFQVRVHGERGDTAVFDVLEAAAGVVLARRDLNVQYHLDPHTASQLLIDDAAAR
jgi:hypothetical protein